MTKYINLVPPTIMYTRKGKPQVIALIAQAPKGKQYRGMGRKDRERREKALAKDQLHADGGRGTEEEER